MRDEKFTPGDSFLHFFYLISHFSFLISHLYFVPLQP